MKTVLAAAGSKKYKHICVICKRIFYSKQKNCLCDCMSCYQTRIKRKREDPNYKDEIIIPDEINEPSKLDSMTPDELLHYGKIKAMEYMISVR